MKEQRLELPNQFVSSDDLFMSHIFIVDGIIKKLYYNNYLKDDLRQVGLIGLFKASNKYNLSFGVKFSTYASYFILGEIKRELRNNKNIRVGQKTMKIINLLNENRSIEEIQSIGYTNDDICLAIEYKDTKYVDLEISNLDSECYDYNYNSLSLEKVADVLSGDLFLVIKYKYFYNLSQKDIGFKLNYSQSKVSRLEEVALNILKKHYDSYI